VHDMPVGVDALTPICSKMVRLEVSRASPSAHRSRRVRQADNADRCRRVGGLAPPSAAFLLDVLFRLERRLALTCDTPPSVSFCDTRTACSGGFLAHSEQQRHADLQLPASTPRRGALAPMPHCCSTFRMWENDA